MIKIIMSFLFALLLNSCDTQELSGEELFSQNCAVCHGVKATGIYPDWRNPPANATMNPPPLNGSAHTWHHPPKLLLQIINDGGAKIGGQMPSFEDKLSKQQREKILNYIQSLWPNDIKVKYNKRFNTDIKLQ